MLTVIVVAVYGMSFVLPTVVALGVAVYGHGYSRYFIGMLGLMLAFGINMAVAYYSYTIHPEWWNDPKFVTAIVFAYFIVGTAGNGIGIGWSLKVARLVDEEHNAPDNVRGIQRSA